MKKCRDCISGVRIKVECVFQAKHLMFPKNSPLEVILYVFMRHISAYVHVEFHELL
uniref:hypothetical protein n=1 Tax=Anaplasma phagocytophilum TaxID=948 RepID=UPI0012BB5B49|nr:hypothetical protein [Anaplasma phagocytophilum]